MEINTRKLLLVLLAVLIISCKKDKKTEPTPTPSPSPSTWFTAKVGSVRDFNADTLLISIDTLTFQKRKLTQISSIDKDNYKIILSFESRDTGIFELGNSGTLNYLRFIDPNENIWSSYPQSGYLHVTKYDTLNNIMSGVFYGNIKKYSPPFDTINVTSGKFENLIIFQ